MTDSLYFSTNNNQRSLRWKLTRLGTRGLRLCCPRLAERLLRRMLSPCARSKVTDSPEHFTLTSVDTAHGALQVYTDHFMIAPLFGLLEQYQERIDRFGIDPDLFAATLSRFEQEYNFRFKDIDEEPRLAKLTARVQIIHNQGDRIAPIAASQKMANRFSRVNLVTQPGNGHSRIIKTDATENALLKFLG